jgi:hypothetical protein
MKTASLVLYVFETPHISSTHYTTVFFVRHSIFFHQSQVKSLADVPLQLRHRKERIRELGFDDSFSYHEPPNHDPLKPYAMRFDHNNPRGIMVNQESAQAFSRQLREQRAQKLAAETALKAREVGCFKRTWAKMSGCAKWTCGLTLMTIALGAILFACFFNVRTKERYGY